MLRRPLIVGANGNMGRRYSAILRHLSVKPVEMDIGDHLPKAFDSVIIASPTALHIEHCRKFAEFGVPILVEKPIAKDVDAVLDLLDDLEGQVPLKMVNQYRYLGRFHGEGPTWYDYFKSGGDSLPWDCISLIALAHGRVRLENKSPFWDCGINGESLRIDKMDEAYVAMIADWLCGERDDTGYIRTAHCKVADYIERQAK